MNRLKVVGISLIIPLLIGCSKEYQSNMDARKQIAWTQSTNQRLAVGEVMQVISVFLSPFEEIYIKNNSGSSSYNLTPNSEATFAVAAMADVLKTFIGWQGRAELTRARAQAIQYLTPIIESIYSQHMSDFGTPLSTNGVIAKLVGHVPFLATVGGMYGLGVKAASEAGETVTANLNDASKMNYKGTADNTNTSIGTENIITSTPDNSIDNSTEESVSEAPE